MEKGMATLSSILAWRIPMDKGAWWATVHEVANSWTRLSANTKGRLKWTKNIYISLMKMIRKSCAL